MGYISAAGVGWRAAGVEASSGSWQLVFRFRVSESSFVGWFFCSLLQVAWPLLGPSSPQSSDLVDRDDRTTSGSPAAMNE